jgi:hypothetical protein
MRTGSQFMVMLFMMAVASALALVTHAWLTGGTPDVERLAGRKWADLSHEAFSDCPRDNGIRFWMGCTDEAPIKKGRP